MQVERGSFCELLHHIKIIISKISLAISYKSTRRPTPPKLISAQNSFLGVLNSTKNLQIGKCDIKLGIIFG